MTEKTVNLWFNGKIHPLLINIQSVNSRGQLQNVSFSKHFCLDVSVGIRAYTVYAYSKKNLSLCWSCQAIEYNNDLLTEEKSTG